MLGKAVIVSTSSNPQAEEPRLVDCLRLLTQYMVFAATCLFWRPFLHSQIEDASCHGGREGLTMDPLQQNH